MGYGPQTRTSLIYNCAYYEDVLNTNGQPFDEIHRTSYRRKEYISRFVIIHMFSNLEAPQILPFVFFLMQVHYVGIIVKSLMFCVKLKFQTISFKFIGTVMKLPNDIALSVHPPIKRHMTYIIVSHLSPMFALPFCFSECLFF